MMSRIHAYWASREPRERGLLLLCAALLLAALLYALWAPLASEQKRQQRRLPQLQQDAQRMQQLVTQWKGSPAAQPSRDWRAASQASLVTFALTSQQAKLLGSDAEVQRWQFDNVPFNAFLDWLTRLYNEAGVRVRSIKLTPAGPGNVSVSLELHHP